MKNKKADLNVTLMVFMALVIFISMLFIFITSQKNLIRSMINPKIVEEVYLEEYLMKFYVSSLCEEALYNSYQNIGDGSPIPVEIRIQEEFKKNFDEQINSNVNIPYVNQLKEKNDKGEIEITFTDSNIEVLVKNFEIIESEFSKTRKMIKIWKIIPTFSYEEKITQSLGISYNPDIKVTLAL